MEPNLGKVRMYMVVRVGSAIVFVHMECLPSYGKCVSTIPSMKGCLIMPMIIVDVLVVSIVCWFIPCSTVLELVWGWPPPFSSSSPNLLFNTLIALVSLTLHFHSSGNSEGSFLHLHHCYVHCLPCSSWTPCLKMQLGPTMSVKRSY